MRRLALLLLCIAATACGKADDKKAEAATAAVTTVPTNTTAIDAPLLSEAQLADSATFVTVVIATNSERLCDTFKYFPATGHADCSGPDFTTAIELTPEGAAPILAALKDVVTHDFGACAADTAAEYAEYLSVNGGDQMAVGIYHATQATWSCQNAEPRGVIAKTAPTEGRIAFAELLQNSFKTLLDAARIEHPLLTADKLTADDTVVTFTFESNSVPSCDWYTYKPKSGSATCGLFPSLDALKTKSVAGADKSALDLALADLSVRTVESCPDPGVAREYFPHLTYKGDKVDVGTYKGGAWSCTAGDNDAILIARTAPTAGSEPAFITLLKSQLN